MGDTMASCEIIKGKGKYAPQYVDCGKGYELHYNDRQSGAFTRAELGFFHHAYNATDARRKLKEMGY